MVLLGKLPKKKVVKEEYSNDAERTRALENVLDAIYVKSGEMLLTWKELAKKAKVNYMTVLNIGDRKSNGRIETVAKLAKAVDLSFQLVKVERKKTGRMGARVKKN